MVHQISKLSELTLQNVPHAPIQHIPPQAHGWTLQDFTKFYRPDDCRKAMALARARDGDSRTEEDLKRAELIEEGNKVVRPC